MPEATLLLIGDATGPIDELLALPNVVWLGFRPYEEIPAYGAIFDVALMPWLRNEWIAYANPIKLKEYLALGLPVVSTDFPEVRFYDDVVAIADDEADFVRLVREALDGSRVGTVSDPTLARGSDPPGTAGRTSSSRQVSDPPAASEDERGRE